MAGLDSVPEYGVQDSTYNPEGLIMAIDTTSNPDASRDLTRSVSAWLLWYLPIVLLIGGGVWRQKGVWLWVIAFAVMGAGCVANLARCQRTHCYVTGPLFLTAALWCLLSALGVVVMHPNVVILIVVVITALAYLAEIPFGRYLGARR